MIITVKEQRVRVKKPYGGSYWSAVVRNGEATTVESIIYSPTCESIEAYIGFLKEVIEAIKNTAP